MNATPAPTVRAMTRPDRYGCFDRADYKPVLQLEAGRLKEVPPFGKLECQYRFTKLGQQDPRCEGCQRKNAPED